jgi:hypothetical protein
VTPAKATSVLEPQSHPQSLRSPSCYASSGVSPGTDSHKIRVLQKRMELSSTHNHQQYNTRWFFNDVQSTENLLNETAAILKTITTFVIQAIQIFPDEVFATFKNSDLIRYSLNLPFHYPNFTLKITIKIK